MMRALQTDALVGEIQYSGHPENDLHLRPYPSTFYCRVLLGTPGPWIDSSIKA